MKDFGNSRKTSLIALTLVGLLLFGIPPASITTAQAISLNEPGAYLNYTELTTYIDDLENNHGSIVKVYDIGVSWESRIIKAIRITDNPGEDENEPELLIIGNVHGNETISGDIVIGLVHALVSGYQTNETTKRLVDSRDIWFIPVVNPDGRELSLEGTSWKKNMRANPDGSYGVDLNRNFDSAWGGSNSSGDPLNETYRGPSAFSEPETIAIRDLVDQHNFTMVIDYHGGGQEIGYPWAHRSEKPRDDILLTAISEEIAQRTSLTSTARYSSTVETPGAGEFVDWAYQQGALSFSINTGNNNSPSDPIPYISAQKQGLEYILENADRPQQIISREWSIYVYMSALDAEMYGAALEDINEMEVWGPSEDAYLTVLFDGNGHGDTNIYDIQKDPIGYHENIVSEKVPDTSIIPYNKELNMGDEKTLEDFLLWSLNNRPGNKTMLVFWGHGNGIFKGVCNDNGDWITLWEMSSALDNALSKTSEHGKEKIDIIGFDVCWFAHAEIAFEVSPYTEYVVFSQDEEPLDGWEYSDILEILKDHPTITPEELAVGIVETFWQDNVWASYTTISAINMENYTQILQPAIDDLAHALNTNYYEYQQQIRNAISNTEKYRSLGDDPDLGDMIRNLLKEPLPSELYYNLNRTLEAIDAAVVIERHAMGHRTTGMSVYLPSFEYTSEYEYMAMSATPWGIFARQYLDPTPLSRIIHSPSYLDFEGTGPYTINVNLEPTNAFNEAWLRYATGENEYEVPLTQENDLWQAVIPAQITGTLVQYYLVVDNDIGAKDFLPPMHNGKNQFFQFTAGEPGDLSINNITWEWGEGNLTIEWDNQWSGISIVELDIVLEAEGIRCEQTIEIGTTTHAKETIEISAITEQNITLTIDRTGIVIEKEEGNNQMTFSIPPPEIQIEQENIITPNYWTYIFVAGIASAAVITALLAKNRKDLPPRTDSSIESKGTLVDNEIDIIRSDEDDIL